jgi:serine protease DegQ
LIRRPLDRLADYDARLVMLGVWAVAALLLAGCGIVVVDEPKGDPQRIAAPWLVDVDPSVEAETSARTLAVSRRSAKRQVRRGALRIRNTGCDGMPTGSGFALDSTLLIAHRDVLPGAGTLKVAPRKGRRLTVDATSVYRLGDFGIARVERRVPRTLPLGRRVALGASVVVVGYPLAGKPRLLRGVVVDRVPGAPFGIRGRVLRLTSALRHDEPGGPVLDPRGRIVAVAFDVDPGTGLAVAVPIRTLRSLVAARALEALEPC